MLDVVAYTGAIAGRDWRRVPRSRLADGEWDRWDSADGWSLILRIASWVLVDAGRTRAIGTGEFDASESLRALAWADGVIGGGARVTFMPTRKGLMNYTTTVDASKTAGEVVSLLASAGALEVTMIYEAGKPSGLAFVVDSPALGAQRYRLPVNVEAVLGTLTKQVQTRKIERRFAVRDQAARVAWRILLDWVDAQLAIIQTRSVTLDQVMLPYMLNGDGRTIYEFVVERHKALPGPPGGGRG